MKPLRILWHSVAPWVQTGYGVQTRYALRIFEDLKSSGGAPIEDIALSCFYGLQGGRTRINGCLAYGNPADRLDPWGCRGVEAWYRDFGADLVITLIDAWAIDLHPQCEARWIPWFPVDHDPVPAAVIRALHKAWRCIAMSQFGRDACAQVGIEAQYIPHCLDSGALRPLRRDARRRAKERLGFGPKDFVFGMVAANKSLPCRKAFPEVMAAFSQVVETHPRARLYIHSQSQPTSGGRLDLPMLAEQFGVDRWVHFTPDTGYDTRFARDQDMAVLYNGFDCLLSPSLGEGFGVPIIEAQSCGIPVITHDCTSMPEITVGGWVVPRGTPLYTQFGSYMYIPDSGAIAATMRIALASDAAELRRLGEAGRQYVVEHFDYRAVRDQFWKPRLTELAEAIALEDGRPAAGTCGKAPGVNRPGDVPAAETTQSPT